jgi:hypothetical protein
MNTYWVGYTYRFKLLNEETNEFEDYEDVDACRFHCLKKDIKKEVEKTIRESFGEEEIRDLEINIYEFYLTTDYEI